VLISQSQNDQLNHIAKQKNDLTSHNPNGIQILRPQLIKKGKKQTSKAAK